MATTSMDFTLSSTLLGNLTKGGSGNGAYVYAFAFDGAGKLLRSATLVNNGVKAATSLQLADNSTVAGGNVVVVTQQVGKGHTSTLPGTVKAIGDVVNTARAKQLNYRYDAIEFTLLNSGSDVADLTNIVQFGAPISLSVKYSSGKTETRGYAVSGQTIVNDLKALSPAGTQNYPWASGGPLTGQRETLGLANNVVPNPLNVANDWKTYVTGFGGIAGNVYLSAYFNDTGVLSLYKVVYDSGNKVFWLNPVSLGSGVETTKNSLKIPFAALTQNIYTQTGSLERYSAMNGSLLQTYSTFTPNDAWGQITRSLVAGFDAGLWGGSANSINPKVSGTIDLNQTWNWSAPYTYQAITAPAGTNNFGYTNSIGLGTGTVGDPNRKMYYDPFAAEFVKYSNAYGYSYSDLLSEGGGVNPSLSLYDAGANRNVSSIGVKLFDLGETPTGYTKPSFAYVAPSGSTYKAASTKSTDQFLFDFSLGKYFPAAGVPVTFRFYAPGDAQAKNGFVSFSLPTGATQNSDYEQSFTVGGSAGHWTLTPNGFSGKRGYLLISGVPVTSDGSTGWYQMVIGSGALAKTYNIYVQSSPSSPTSRITSAVVDGGALAEQIPNQANQVKFSFDPAGNITYSPFYFAAPNAQVGSSGADRLVGSAVQDILVGGTGNDFYHVNDSADHVSEAVGDGYDHVYSSVSWSMADDQEIEYLGAVGAGALSGVTLTGNELANRLVGGSGADVLNGGGGRDRLQGNAGADTMSGGAGNDTFNVDNVGDQVIEAAGGGTDGVRSSVSWSMAAGQEIEYLRAVGAGALSGVTLTGNELANHLIGGSGSDVLNSGAGNDHLDGSAGADTLSGGTGNDAYGVDDAGDQVLEAAGGGYDHVYSSVSWSMAAGQEIEYLGVRRGVTSGVTLTGNAFANRLVGGGGDDVLNGGGGRDRLDGNAGADTLSGGADNDTYYVDNAGDQVIEAAGGGTDGVRSSVSWSMAAHQAIEYLRAVGAGATSGVTLTGNELANHLIGGSGGDVLVGGGGNDIFRFDTPLAPGNVDTISDFSVGDSLQLDHTVFAGLALGQLSATAFALDSASGAGPQIVYNHTTGALFFDSNGAAAGGATQFASLTGAPGLGASSFNVI